MQLKYRVSTRAISFKRCSCVRGLGSQQSEIFLRSPHLQTWHVHRRWSCWPNLRIKEGIEHRRVPKLDMPVQRWLIGQQTVWEKVWDTVKGRWNCGREDKLYWRISIIYCGWTNQGDSGESDIVKYGDQMGALLVDLEEIHAQHCWLIKYKHI